MLGIIYSWGDNMVVGIMGAMLEEVESIKRLLEEEQIIEFGGRQYITGKLDNVAVVLAFSRWGKVAAAITATTMITEFSVEK